MTEALIYFVSGSTGLTAEALGRSIMTQFPGVECHIAMRPFIDKPETARELVEEINRRGEDYKTSPVVFCTIINAEIYAILHTAKALVLDFFEPFMGRIAEHLQQPPMLETGLSHHLENYDRYMQRIDAVDFTVVHDDGQSVNKLEQSDIILIGISRTGKTPTSLYLSLHYGLRAANYPITEDDMEHQALPKTLVPFKDKLFGLTTESDTLRKIREKRRPGSRYASIQQCHYEIRQTEAIFTRNHIPFLNTVTISVEEISAKIYAMLRFNQNPNASLKDEL